MASTEASLKTVYELSDHLGNVRAVISFTKVNGQAEVLSYTDYYPHGTAMPGRNYVSSNDYRYAYQGKEKEQNKWIGFDLRMYDGNIGRWMSPDPFGEFHSPYLAMGNDPINRIDPTGGSSGGSGNTEGYHYYVDGMEVEGWYARSEVRGGAKMSFGKDLSAPESNKNSASNSSADNTSGISINNPLFGDANATNGFSGTSIHYSGIEATVVAYRDQNQYISGSEIFNTNDFMNGFLGAPPSETMQGSNLSSMFGTTTVVVESAVKSDLKYTKNLTQINQITKNIKLVKNQGTAFGVAGLAFTGAETLSDGKLSSGDATKLGLAALSIACPVFGVVYGIADLGTYFTTGTSLTDRLASGTQNVISGELTYP